MTPRGGGGIRSAGPELAGRPKLAGRTAFVTGGSRGIGAAIVRTFAREGATVAFTYRSDESAAQQVVGGLHAAGSRCIAIQADVAIEDDCRRAVETAVAEFGKINIVVNNAGIQGREVPVRDLPSDEWHQVVAADLTGTYLTSMFAIPQIPNQPTGKIINLSSELAMKGRAGFAHYCAAKAGVIGFTYALALELAPSICVNAIAPGPIDTDMIRHDLGMDWAARETDIPAGRLGRPGEVAETALLLASDAGDFFIGQVLSPNGGAVFR